MSMFLDMSAEDLEEIIKKVVIAQAIKKAAADGKPSLLEHTDDVTVYRVDRDRFLVEDDLDENVSAYIHATPMELFVEAVNDLF